MALRQDHVASWLDGLPEESEMVGRLRTADWAATSLGPIEGWPPALRAAVSMVMASRFPMMVLWGPELVQVYNDAFVPTYTGRHPQIGRRVRDTWAEIWDFIGPMMHGVVARREATWFEDQVFWIDRLGFAEDAYYTFSYSPILDESRAAIGILVTAVETTDRVVGARRTSLLAELGTRQAAGAGELARRAVEVLGRHPEDIPFACVLLRDAEGELGVAAATATTPSDRSWTVPAGPEVRILPFDGDVLHEQSGRRVRDVAVIPLGVHGSLVVGLSPARRLDDRHREFLALLGTQLEGQLAVASTIEAEQARVDELLALDRARSIVFANVSHELRTPVTLVLGPLHEALADPEHPLDGPQLERIRTAHRNAGRLIGLVDDVLDFTRAEASALRPRPERVALGRLTTELAEAFGPAARPAGLELRIDCPRRGDEVWIDPQMWERIVLNLVSNAVKYTPGGSVAVALRVRDGRARLEVRDTGIGVPQSERRRIFERFHRVAGASTRTSEGVGIGLSLVHRLVELQDGDVGVRSAPGVGSCFWVEIPVARMGAPGAEPPAPAVASLVDRSALAAAEALGWASAASAPAEPGGASADRPRVLYADDNADLRSHVSLVLGSRFSVEAVPDGAQALTAVRAHPPDLVLTDVAMPGMDGFELLSALRADPATAAIPVVLLSARGGSGAVIEALEAGADDYLLKPFASAELVARLTRTVALARMRVEHARMGAQQERDRRFVEAEARHRLAGRAARVGTWSLNLATGAFLADENLEELLGAQPGDVRTLDECLELIVPEDRKRLREEVRQAVRAGDETIREFRVRRADGSLRIFQGGSPAPTARSASCWAARARSWRGRPSPSTSTRRTTGRSTRWCTRCIRASCAWSTRTGGPCGRR